MTNPQTTIPVTKDQDFLFIISPTVSITVDFKTMMTFLLNHVVDAQKPKRGLGVGVSGDKHDI